MRSEQVGDKGMTKQIGTVLGIGDIVPVVKRVTGAPASPRTSSRPSARITSQDWSVVDRPPLKMIRTKSMRRLPDPERESMIEEPRTFLGNMSDDDYTLGSRRRAVRSSARADGTSLVETRPCEKSRPIRAQAHSLEQRLACRSETTAPAKARRSNRISPGPGGGVARLVMSPSVPKTSTQQACKN
jgi:hypothetical protein